ncbi:hypothetical protein [Viridibacillus arvi]|uniref:hypothetical protein n=1 Tax=Viridibacillus arvi TaxID=263475 RepID=UPI003D2A9962
MRFNELEVWDITFDNDIYRMILFDENRPTTVADFSSLQPVFEEDENRSNLITVKVFSESEIKDEHIEQLDDFSKQLTDHIALAHCHVVISFDTQEIESALASFLKEKLGVDYDNIPLEKLKHLNQN